MGLSRACFGLSIAGLAAGIAILMNGSPNNTFLGAVLFIAGLALGGVGWATRKA